MQYDSNTHRAELTIEGVKLSAIAPYNAGHVLTEAEASVLNQTFRENLRNNLATKISTMVTEAEKAGSAVNVDAAQAALDEYTASYEFGVRKPGAGGARVMDPVEREARAIARSKITEKVKAKGHKVKDIPAEQFNGWIDALLKKDKEGDQSIYNAAKTIVETSKEVGAADLDLGLSDKPKEQKAA